MKTLKRVFLAMLLAGVLASGASRLFAQASDDGRGSTPAAHSEQKNEQEKDENEAYKHSAAVKAFGRMVGLDVDAAATVFEIGNFVVLAGLVGWFLVKNLPKTFRNRTSAIQKHLVDARTATAEASARLNSVEERLAKLDGQIAAMKTQAEKDSAADEARIKASVEEEKKKILAAAEQEISAATVLAQRQLQKYAAELAIDQAARRLVVTAETDRLIVQDFARRLGAESDGKGSKGGQN